MSYTLYFRSNVRLTRAGFAAYFRERPGFLGSARFGVFQYGGDGRFFEFVWLSRIAAEKLDPSGDFCALFSLRYDVERSVAQVAAAEVESLVRHFGVETYDPCRGGIRDEPFSPYGLIAGWTAGRELLQELQRSTEPEAVCIPAEIPPVAPWIPTGPLGADEIRSRLQNDARFRDRFLSPADKMFGLSRLDAMVSYLTDAIPVLDDLAAQGYVVHQLGALRRDNLDVVPLLMRWALRLPPGEALWDVTSTLARPALKKEMGPFLLRLYQQIPPHDRGRLALYIPAVAHRGMEDDLLCLVEKPHTDDRVWARAALIDAVARLGTARAHACLLKFSRDSAEEIRTQVGRSLSRYPGDESTAVLQRLTNDTPDVARAAKASLKKLGRRSKT